MAKQPKALMDMGGLRTGLIAQEQCGAISLELICLPSLCGPFSQGVRDVSHF